MSDDDGNNVSSFPLEGEDIVRHGLRAWLEYMKASQPKPPDPHDAELALFDQVVMTQLHFQRDADEAIRVAQTIIRARRALRSLP